VHRHGPQQTVTIKTKTVTIKTRKGTQRVQTSATWQATILNFVERHISSQNHFRQTAKLEDVQTTAEILQVEDFQYGSFDLEL